MPFACTECGSDRFCAHDGLIRGGRAGEVGYTTDVIGRGGILL